MKTCEVISSLRIIRVRIFENIISYSSVILDEKMTTPAIVIL